MFYNQHFIDLGIKAFSMISLAQEHANEQLKQEKKKF